MEQLVWAAPAILLSAIVIGWAAETAELFVAQGLALAILAWLQTLPEFFVEAVIAWEQKQELMIANLTGSLRLLVGLGWPLIYFSFLLFGKNRGTIKLPKENSLEVFMLLVSVVYFSFIAAKGSLTVVDGALLIGLYAIYLRKLSQFPKKEHDEESELPWVGKKIMTLSSRGMQITMITLLFVLGGIALNFSAPPFLHGLEHLSVYFGISTFVFVQWFAPFVSEFPEKVTAFNWARKPGRASIALMNMAASNIVQWTVMAGMIPIIFSISKKQVTPVLFDTFQTHEIVLTVIQTLLAALYLMDLEVCIYDAAILFVLWMVQFCVPSIRLEMIYVYVFFILVECGVLIKKHKLFYALQTLREINRKS